MWSHDVDFTGMRSNFPSSFLSLSSCVQDLVVALWTVYVYVLIARRTCSSGRTRSVRVGIALASRRGHDSVDESSVAL